MTLREAEGGEGGGEPGASGAEAAASRRGSARVPSSSPTPGCSSRAGVRGSPEAAMRSA